MTRRVQAAALLFKSTMPHDCIMISDSSLAEHLNRGQFRKVFPMERERNIWQSRWRIIRFPTSILRERFPEGQYGGGTVMIWDRGTFEPLSKAPTKELAGGKLHFVLSGTKLNGEWYLVRLRDEKQWLLIKAGEDMKPISKKLDDTSALSGRTMKELARGDRVWQSKTRSESKRRDQEKAKSKSIAAPEFLEPMRAKLTESIPPGEWLYEIKFDGFRALALRGGSEARLVSRNEKEFGGKFRR